MSINKVFLVGNLTRDPELKALPSGMSVMDVGIAVNDRRKNQQTGEWEDIPNFFDVTLFGARADWMSKELKRGSKVAVDGRLRWHQWETPGGEKRSKVDVVAENIEFLSQRSSQGDSGGEAPARQSAPVDDPGGEEIPF